MARETIGNEPQCLATIAIHDDHWGVFTDQCRLQEGHDGDHRSPRSACEPVAYLGWATHSDGLVEGKSNIGESAS